MEIAFFISISSFLAFRSFDSLSRVSKALRACCISRLFTAIYMKLTRSEDMVKQLSESPAILHAVQNVTFRSEMGTWLPQFNKFPPRYDEFVGMMWSMPHLIGLRLHRIGDLPASLVDFMIHNKALKDLELSDVTISPPAFHLQMPPLSASVLPETLGLCSHTRAAPFNASKLAHSSLYRRCHFFPTHQQIECQTLWN